MNDYIWKYSDGLYLGDVYNVDLNALKSDIIYKNDKPKYILKTRIGYFGFPTEMIIKDIETGKEGRYIGK